MHNRILVGLSGGVDSAIAAYLLKKEGYDVTCAFMRNWDALANNDYEGNPTLNDDICPQESDYNDALAVARKLDLPLLRIDFIKEYWDNVFSFFLSEYRKGRTPNPDILCNRHIKFDSFMNYADKQGFKLVATGHYARIITKNGNKYIAKAADKNKDQSYFLSEVKRDVIEKVVFPLADINKAQVRKIASDIGLTVAEKKDSTGICFIGERKFRLFLSNYLPMRAGKIINIVNGKTVGEHSGVLYYTIGQRKGLDIGGTGPYFVIGKDVSKNELYVTDQAHQDWLYSDSCLVGNINWFIDAPEEIDCSAKFRYRQKDYPVHLRQNSDGTYSVSYPQTVRSVTPGQEAVLYQGDMLLGGGRIDKVYRDNRDILDRIKAVLNG